MAELTGFAVLPADTFAAGPSSGNSIETDNRETPFDSQPVQGFSGVQYAEGSAFWFLSDNGFGAKENSADYRLRIYQLNPSFTGEDGGDASVEVLDFIQLSDPNNLIPFEIVNEGTSNRFLTGGDFDIESFVITNNGDIWVGDEFGPYLLKFNGEGELLEAPIATPNIFNFNTLNGQPPIVIGHRGASGERPEHTLQAYELAIEQGADFIEPDLVPTKDGVLIARHENALATVELDDNGEIVFDADGNPTVTSETTNVAELSQFADRLTVKSIDGDVIGGWFSEDFTLDEIKQLLARERIPAIRPDNTEFNDEFEIPTLAEVIELVNEVEADTGQEIGIYPETKHPTFFAKEGTFVEDGAQIAIDTSQILIDTLVAENFTDPNRIFIQSFEIENLLDLQNNIMPEAEVDIPLVQLLGDVEDAFINENGGGFSVPYDIVYNFGDNDDADPTVYDGFPIAFDAETNYSDLANADVINFIGGNYAEGLGPWKNSFVLRESLDDAVDADGDGNAEITSQLTGEVRPYIQWAHDAGMQIHPYTLRNEERYLVLDTFGNPQTPEQEFEQLINLGVDGFFTDFPGTGDLVRDRVVEEFVRSPQNPEVEAGNAVANLSTSRGFEGMAISPNKRTLYPMLEGSVAGDPENALRIYEFNPGSESFDNQLVGFYGLEDPSNAIGDFTVINENEFLVIERDGNQADEAELKKVYKIDLSQVDDDGFVAKEEVADLLDIDDPNDLNDDGSDTFDFPFVTIEDVLVLDENTILVANDNNYPFSIGRPPEIDNNEIITIQLDAPLELAEGIGRTTPTVSIDVAPDTVSEGEEYSLTVNLSVPAPESGLRVVWSETDSDNAFGDIEVTPDLTNASNLESLDPVGDEIGRSAITIDAGATTATVTWRTTFDGEDEGDETTTFELQAEDGYVVDSENQVAQLVIEDTPVDDDVRIEGSAESERLGGGTGNDTIVGLNGADTLAGSFGNDEIIGGRGNDFLYGQSGNDTLEGRRGGDRLFGGGGNDILNGGQGRDRLNGGSGNDTLSGGASRDRFIFSTNEEFTGDDVGIDDILDFVPGQDLILLDATTFTEISDIATDFGTVTNNGAAASSDAIIVYNTTNGNLFYNANGAAGGFGGGRQFATLVGAPDIDAEDFSIRG